MSIFDYTNQLILSRVLIYRCGLKIKPRGNVINVALSTRATRFDLTFHMHLRKRISKKYHTAGKKFILSEETIEFAKDRKKFKENNVSQYHLSGICVALKSKGLVTSCIIRNVLSSFPFEYRIPVFSPAVNSILIQAHHLAPGHRRAKRYLLRKFPPATGRTSFHYVVSVLAPEDYHKYRQIFWS
jgi:ribosomal protein L19